MKNVYSFFGTVFSLLMVLFLVSFCDKPIGLSAGGQVNLVDAAVEQPEAGVPGFVSFTLDGNAKNPVITYTIDGRKGEVIYDDMDMTSEVSQGTALEPGKEYLLFLPWVNPGTHSVEITVTSETGRTATVKGDYTVTKENIALSQSGSEDVSGMSYDEYVKMLEKKYGAEVVNLDEDKPYADSAALNPKICPYCGEDMSKGDGTGDSYDPVTGAYHHSGPCPFCNKGGKDEGLDGYFDGDSWDKNDPDLYDDPTNCPGYTAPGNGAGEDKFGPSGEKLVNSIGLSSSSVCVDLKKTVEIDYVIQPSDATSKNVIATSSDSEVARVSVSGGKIKVIGWKEGTCTINIKSNDVGGESTFLTVNVAKPSRIRAISMTPDFVKIPAYEDETATVSVAASDTENPQYSCNVTVSNPRIASVDFIEYEEFGGVMLYNLIVHGRSQGECVVTVSSSDGKVKGTLNVKVLPRRTYLQNIFLNNYDLRDMKVGSTQVLFVVGVYPFNATEKRVEAYLKSRWSFGKKAENMAKAIFGGDPYDINEAFRVYTMATERGVGTLIKVRAMRVWGFHEPRSWLIVRTTDGGDAKRKVPITTEEKWQMKNGESEDDFL